ncbi:MAG: hypothetical protein KAX80_08785, partial [Planctomycetes bacterium]|nr:hypothetical protein [Planctomycetota bacterium]
MSRLRTRTTSGGMVWEGEDSGFPVVAARVYTLDELPEEVAHDDDRQFAWQARAAVATAFHDLGDIEVPFWVTWDTSAGSSRTAKRMDWATEKADGSASEQAVADAIQDALGGVGVDPPFERGEKEDLGEGWELLDGSTYGECDEQAYLMELAVRMIGVPALTRGVYASSDAGAGDCLELEHKFE